MLPPPYPPDDLIDRSRWAGKRRRSLNLAMFPSSRLFPLVMRSCVFAGLAEWHGHTVCSHCESVPSKYLNGMMSSRYLKHGQHTISPVSFSPLQPRHTVSVRALSSSSSSSSIDVRLFPIIRQRASSLGGPPVGTRFISMCCALRRAGLGAILSLILFELTARAVRVFEYPAICATSARRREQRLSKSERKMRRVVCFETRSTGRL